MDSNKWQQKQERIAAYSSSYNNDSNSRVGHNNLRHQPTSSAGHPSTPLLLATSSDTSTSMDGPTIPWTVADLFGKGQLGLVYHVAGSGYDALTPMGAVLGTVLALALGKPKALATFAGTGGLAGGTFGMIMGLGGLYGVAKKGESNTPLPYNEDGIATRMAGISTNYKIRVLDRNVWLGIGIMMGALVAGGGRRPLQLLGLGNNGGIVVGTLQALSLGSTAGSLSAFTQISLVERQKNQALAALNEDDEDD